MTSPTGSNSDQQPESQQEQAPWMANCSVLCTQRESHRQVRLNVPREKDLIPDPLRNAMRDCTRGRAPWPLYIYGPPGAGKTCGALYLCDWTPQPYYYWSVTEICERLRAAAIGTLETSAGYAITERTIWGHEIAKAELIVLDALGEKEKVSDHHYSTVKRLVDIRECRPLVLVSNLPPNDLASLYDERISSRCGAGTVVDLSGFPDQRRA